MPSPGTETNLFNGTIAAANAGRAVRCVFLVELDFVSGARRLASHPYSVDAGGHTWAGLGALGSIGNLEQAINGAAPETSLTLSGVDAAILTSARTEWTTEAQGRDVTVYLLHLAANADTALDAPVALWSGKMQRATFSAAANGARILSIQCESLFALRSRSKNAYYTEADQQRRFAGDRGFEFAASLVDKVIQWPKF